jgi:HSP20 family protein
LTDSGKQSKINKQEDFIMTIIRYAPGPRFTDIFDNMFEREADRMQHRNCGCLPRTNIIEKEDKFLIELAVPGMKKDDFRINLEKDLLTVSTEVETKESEERYTMKEFEKGAFSRSFIVPKAIDRDAIKADYEHGILTVTLPKRKEEVKVSKEISIS